ncbi:hypothetical protein [Lyngbya sp. CCY1209]|jgi:hypothetical protein|uniref:hypothetical protein n=1 Tax=Lyngbya sp. CCY1209 TaxID=2886103 RepID=UPI002D20DF46|nr:hypothetical protein [Lyngbya sp. CCY1209]MEB3887353.1 hypothetical protein [Lyngbya sp. CCY1209]
MSEITVNESQLKELIKVAILELITEEKEVLSSLLSEVLEDLAMEKAIQEGESTDLVSREAIFKALDR